MTNGPGGAIRAGVTAGITAVAILAAALPALPQGAGCTRDAMLVFDGSGSMAEMGFNRLDAPRIAEARRALRRAVPRVAPVRRIGLVIYGPGPEETCENVSLRFAPLADAAPRILAEIDALEPAGKTPLTASVLAAAEALGYRERPGVVVLVTDGRETCNGAPCQLAADLAAEAPGLVVHVIGFKVRGDFFQWQGETSRDDEDYENAQSVARCLADRTGGLYVSAETVDELVAALMQTLGCNVYGGLRRRAG